MGGIAGSLLQLFPVNTKNKSNNNRQQRIQQPYHGKFNRKRVIDLSKWRRMGVEMGMEMKVGAAWSGSEREGFVGSLANCHQIIIS